MIIETIRLVSTALAHPTYGVNAQLATLPLLPGDTTPATVQLVADSMNNGDVARGYVPLTTSPVVGVSVQGTVQMSGEIMSYERIGHVPVMIAVAVQDSHSERATSTMYYLMRAVQRSLRAFMRNDNAADRTLGNVLIFAIETDMQQQQLTAPVNDAPATAGLLVTMEVHDTNP